MPSSATTNLLLEKQAATENAGAWGDNLNVALDIVDAAISGVTLVTTTGGDTTLTDANYTADEAKSMILDVDGTLASNATITVPSRSKVYIVRNGTSGAYTLTIKTSAGSGVVVAQGSQSVLVVDAVADDVYSATSPNPPTNDGDSLGESGLAWSDLYLANGGIIDFNAGDVTIAHSAANNLRVEGAIATTFAYSGAPPEFNASRLDIHGAAPIAYFDFEGKDSADNLTVYARIYGYCSDDTSGSEDGQLRIQIMDGGVGTLLLNITGTGIVPLANDKLQLGTGATAFSDLFLASGAVINFNAGDVTLTHSSNALDFDGATNYAFKQNASFNLNLERTDTPVSAGTAANLYFKGRDNAGSTINYGKINGYMASVTAGAASGLMSFSLALSSAETALMQLRVGDLRPNSNGLISLGASGVAWSNLFLASGAVINFNAGDVVLTHSSNALTVSGGTFTSEGNLFVGVDDTTQGMISIYGAGTGGEGGEIRLYRGADDDTTYDFWGLDVDGSGHFRLFRSNGGGEAFSVNESTGNMIIGAASTFTAGRLHVSQPSLTGAVPVLYLDQADLSEEFIRFDATDAAGNAVDSAHTPATGIVGYVRVNINGTDRWMPFYD